MSGQSPAYKLPSQSPPADKLIHLPVFQCLYSHLATDFITFLPSSWALTTISVLIVCLSKSLRLIPPWPCPHFWNIRIAIPAYQKIWIRHCHVSTVCLLVFNVPFPRAVIPGPLDNASPKEMAPPLRYHGIMSILCEGQSQLSLPLLQYLIIWECSPEECCWVPALIWESCS